MTLLHLQLSLAMTLSYILLQFHVVHTIPTTPGAGPTNGAEHEDLLPTKALEICRSIRTTLCVAGNPDSSQLCELLAKTAGGADFKCETENACTFNLAINGTNKRLYVSHSMKISAAGPTSVTYKTCKNHLLLYTM
uniref:Uncharacterized protein n=1 Tax=Cacopsylla melanoneura TaxID=428564 RepID=A0A8D8VGH5_9HEMI